MAETHKLESHTADPMPRNLRAESLKSRAEDEHSESLWHVYILRCADGSLYTGITTDPERRVREHNESNRGARYTRARRPVSLVYLIGAADRSAASGLEFRIKQLNRSEKEALLNDHSAPS